MLNFAQLSATLNLRAVMEKTRGAVDEELLGRLQNSASDRNWDSIEALWRMKNEVRDDPELRAAFGPRRRHRDRRGPARLRPRAGVHRRAGRAVPARVRLARGLEPRVHLPDGARADGAGARAHPRLRRERLRLPVDDRGDAPRHRGGVGRDPRRPDGRRARRDARRQRDQPADGAAHARPPLLHRPGRERARPAGADRDRPQARRGGAPRRARRRDVPALQRAADADRRPGGGRRARRSSRRGARSARRRRRSGRATGSAPRRRRSSPSRTSSTGATRSGSTRSRARATRPDHGDRRLAGRRRGDRARRPDRGRVRRRHATATSSCAR